MPSQYPDAYSESDPLLKKKSDLASQFGADQKQELVQSQKPPEPAQQTLAPVQPMQQASMQKPATNTGNVQMQGPSTNMGANAMTPAAGGANGYKPPNPGGQAPSPTNFTNFGRYQSANQASSDAESQRLISGATDKANAAKAQLADLQRQFGAQVQAGSVGAAPHGMPQGMSAEEQAAYKANPQAADALDRKYGMSAADMQAKANGAYSGPGGLGDVAGYQGAVDAAKAAQDNLDALKTPGGIQALEQQKNSAGNAGTSGFSAGLVGSAGQKGFQALRSQFNPAADTAKAETDAAPKADQAKMDSAANAADWAKAAGVRMDKDTARQAYAQAEATQKKKDQDEATTKRLAQIPKDPKQVQNFFYGVNMQDPKEMQQRSDEYKAYTAAMATDTNQNINNYFEDFNSVASPVNWVTNAAGVRDPVQDMETRSTHAAEGAASGGTNGRNIDWQSAGPAGFWVWRNMTPDDWKTLNSKPRNGGNGQRAWIQTRLNQLMNDKGT